MAGGPPILAGLTRLQHRVGLGRGRCRLQFLQGADLVDQHCTIGPGRQSRSVRISPVSAATPASGSESDSAKIKRTLWPPPRPQPAVDHRGEVWLKSAGTDSRQREAATQETAPPSPPRKVTELGPEPATEAAKQQAVPPTVKRPKAKTANGSASPTAPRDRPATPRRPGGVRCARGRCGTRP